MASQAAFRAFSEQYNALDRERFGPTAQSRAPPQEDEPSGSASASAAASAGGESPGGESTAALGAATTLADAEADVKPTQPVLSEAEAPNASAVAGGALESAARGPLDSARVMHAEERDADSASNAAQLSYVPPGPFGDDSSEWTGGQSPVPPAARSDGSAESDTVVVDFTQMGAEWGSDDDDGDDEWQGASADEPSNALPADDECVGELDAAHIADDSDTVHGMDSHVRS